LAERTVSVRLLADVSGYRSGVDEAKRKTVELGNTVAGAARSNEQAFNQVGLAVGAVGVAATAGLGAVVNASMGFDKQMSAVQAATGATVGAMGELRQAALDAGAQTVFSATEAAAAQENLAKAGISTADILGGALTGSLDLAAAGELDVASAAEVAAGAMTQFELKGGDVGHIADVLAAGAGKAQGEVADMAAALAQGGLVAAQTGLSLEDTVGTLSAFASNALLGSDAGTSLKTMLLALNPTSDEAAATMRELGLRFYDAEGRFVGIQEVAGQLQAASAGCRRRSRTPR